MLNICNVSEIHFYIVKANLLVLQRLVLLNLAVLIMFTKYSKKGVHIVFVGLTLENTLYTLGIKESVKQKLLANS